MRIVFMGTPDFALPSLQTLVDGDHEVVGVVTQPDRPGGRGLKLNRPPVKRLAEQIGVPILQPERLKSRSFREELGAWQADLFVVVAFRILPVSILAIPPKGSVNLHASLLPKYRGAAPIQWAIVNGEHETGVTTFFLDRDVDTGSILMQQPTPIGPDETGGQLHDRMMKEGAVLLGATVDAIGTGVAKSLRQEGESTSAPKLLKADGLLDWTQSAKTLHNRIRGLNPYPMAFTHRGDKTLRVLSSRLSGSDAEAGGRLPGEILTVEGSQGIRVQTGHGSLLITELQPEGKKRMAAEAFVRGYRMAAGDRLGRVSTSQEES
jgi:methionyl-tRNA formyltransferase